MLPQSASDAWKPRKLRDCGCKHHTFSSLEPSKSCTCQTTKQNDHLAKHPTVPHSHPMSPLAWSCSLASAALTAFVALFNASWRFTAQWTSNVQSTQKLEDKTASQTTMFLRTIRDGLIEMVLGLWDLEHFQGQAQACWQRST